MPMRGLALVFPLLIGFFMEGFGICDRTVWAKVGWEIFPEEMPYLKVQLPPSPCLPYPLDRLCCNLSNKDALRGCLRLLCLSLEALGLILLGLSVHYLWAKWQKHKKKVLEDFSSTVKDLPTVSLAQLETQGCANAPSKGEKQPSYDVDQILCKLLATTSMMTKFLNQAFVRPPTKKGKNRKVRGKRAKEGPQEPALPGCKCSAIPYEDHARNVLAELM